MLTKNRKLVKIIMKMEAFYVIKISPSILGLASERLNEVIDVLNMSKTDLIHVDVMDGKFVPNTSFTIEQIKNIFQKTTIPLDIHLMIEEPHKYIKEYIPYAEYLGVHYEAVKDCENTLREIKRYGVKPYLVIKPNTSAEEIFPFLSHCDMVLVMSVEPGFGGQKFIPKALEKIKKIKKYINENNLNVLVEVDGGVNNVTGKEAVTAGADVLVVGSYLFSDNDIMDRITKIKNL